MAVVGQALKFGVTTDVASTITQKVSSTRKSDRKEARDKGGKVIAVNWYNQMNDFNVDFLGSASVLPGATVALGADFTLVGTGYADEIVYTEDNQDFAGGSIKGTAWEGIPGT